MAASNLRPPWLVSYDPMDPSLELQFGFKLTNLYSQSQFIMDWTACTGYEVPVIRKYIMAFVSKDGLMLLGGKSGCFYLHRPFTSVVISLPQAYSLFDLSLIATTFTAYPKYPDCVFLVLSQSYDLTFSNNLWISRHCPSKDGDDWSTKLVEVSSEEYVDVHCMEGNLIVCQGLGQLKDIA